jgi:hypothetical protein
MLSIRAYFDWNPIDAENEELTAKDFHASNRFVYNFKQRHSFSSRRAHYKRRASGKILTNSEIVQCWVRKIQYLVREREHELSDVINCDETCWRLYPNGILTWAKKGSDGVSLDFSGNEKAAIIVLATISAAGMKLSLFILAKGKTKRVESTQFGNLSEHRGDRSPTGCTTAETMRPYLI